MKQWQAKLSRGEILQLFDGSGEVFRPRLEEFARVPPSEYFYELVYCLLTPQSSAVNAAKAVELLRRHDLRNGSFDPEQLLHQKDFYIRFHKTKAKHLIAMKTQYPLILEQLTNGSSSELMKRSHARLTHPRPTERPQSFGRAVVPLFPREGRLSAAKTSPSLEKR